MCSLACLALDLVGESCDVVLNNSLRMAKELSYDVGIVESQIAYPWLDCKFLASHSFSARWAGGDLHEGTRLMSGQARLLLWTSSLSVAARGVTPLVIEYDDTVSRFIRENTRRDPIDQNREMYWPREANMNPYEDIYPFLDPTAVPPEERASHRNVKLMVTYLDPTLPFILGQATAHRLNNYHSSIKIHHLRFTYRFHSFTRTALHNAQYPGCRGLDFPDNDHRDNFYALGDRLTSYYPRTVGAGMLWPALRTFKDWSDRSFIHVQEVD
eukprot:g20871.t1